MRRSFLGRTALWVGACGFGGALRGGLMSRVAGARGSYRPAQPGLWPGRCLWRTERRKAGTQMRQTTAGRTVFSPVPISVVLARLIHNAPAGQVTLAWLMDHLHTRSFGIILLLLGVCGLLPVVSPIAGLLLFIPAFQMIRARPAPIFPRWVAERPIATDKLADMLMRIIPALRYLERLHPAPLAHALRSNQARDRRFRAPARRVPSCSRPAEQHPDQPDHCAGGLRLSGRGWHIARCCLDYYPRPPRGSGGGAVEHGSEAVECRLGRLLDDNEPALAFLQALAAVRAAA